jgi:hypothetical protein
VNEEFGDAVRGMIAAAGISRLRIFCDTAGAQLGGLGLPG